VLPPRSSIPNPHPRAAVAGASRAAGGHVGSAAAKMNDADVSKQIQQMVRFIRQEAEEKASEISVSAEEVSFLPTRFPCLLGASRSFPMRSSALLAARSGRRAP